MSYPQDPKSCRALNTAVDQVQTWGLVIIVGGRIAELQRWSNSGQIDSQSGPKSLLRHIEVTGDQLTFYYKKGLMEWNILDGSTNQAVYEENQSVPTEDVYRAAPGKPQFRAKNSWCAVITDGDIKICHPQDIFSKAQADWQALPASKKANLLGAPVLKSVGGHVWKGLKIATVLSAVAFVLFVAGWVYTKLGS